MLQTTQKKGVINNICFTLCIHLVNVSFFCILPFKLIESRKEIQRLLWLRSFIHSGIKSKWSNQINRFQYTPVYVQKRKWNNSLKRKKNTQKNRIWFSHAQRMFNEAYAYEFNFFSSLIHLMRNLWSLFQWPPIPKTFLSALFHNRRNNFFFYKQSSFTQVFFRLVWYSFTYFSLLLHTLTEWNHQVILSISMKNIVTMSCSRTSEKKLTEYVSIIITVTKEREISFFNVIE